MQFRYSSLVDPSEYDDDGLCAGYTLRINRDQELIDLGTIRAQEDWNENVGPVGFYKGCLGPQYSFISVAVPECLPDRIEIYMTSSRTLPKTRQSSSILLRRVLGLTL
jgi:hypothetical protein